MNFLAIDFGTYSIKFIQYSLERKSVKLHQVNEVVLTPFLDQLNANYTFQELQIDVARSFIKEINHEGRLVFTAPESLLTHRVLHLPIKSKKKAREAIPFQLEEDAPFSAGDLHYASLLIPEGVGFHALVGMSSLKEFADYFTLLEQKMLMPYFLTSAPSIFQGYVYQERAQSNLAILDIGHKTTKAHIFNRGRLISTHLSYTAGKVIDDIIAQSYNISVPEAVIYKHQNSFCLTDAQMADVSEEQREFAQLMKRVFAPIINDFRKWELGLRIKYGEKIDEVILTGGTSNMANIQAFLTEGLQVKVTLLNSLATVTSAQVPQTVKEQRAFNISYLLASAFVGKVPLMNLRSGAFASSDYENIPLHSSAFIMARTAIILAIFIVSFFIESFILSSYEKTFDSRITRMLKNPELAVPAKMQQSYSKNPEAVYQFFKKKETQVEQEIRTLQSITQVSPLFPLIKLGNIVGDAGVEMIRFSSQDGKIEASFKGNDRQTIEALEKTLKNSGMNLSKIQVVGGGTQLDLAFKEIP